MKNNWFLVRASDIDHWDWVFAFNLDENIIPSLRNAMDFSHKTTYTSVEFLLSPPSVGVYQIPGRFPESLLDEFYQNGYAVLYDISLLEQWKKIDMAVYLKLNPYLTILGGRVESTGEWIESKDITLLIREIIEWRPM